MSAAGGLLAAAFLQSAVANADAFDYEPNADATTFSSLGGLPPLDQVVGVIQGSGDGPAGYSVVDTTTGAHVGAFDGVTSQDFDTFGLNSQEILVTGGVSGADAPPVGSLLYATDVFGFHNVYSDIAATTPGGTNTITDTVVTPFGDLNLPASFDAAAALPAAEFTSPANSAFDAGDTFAPATETYTSISALPFDQTVSGTAGYVVDNAAGQVTKATFDGVSFHEINAFSPSDQEILVSGASSGGAPADGSIFNTVDYGNGFENVYSDVVGTGADPTHTITDTIVTPFGDYNMPSTFDASAAYQPVDFTQSAVGTDAGYTFTPTGSETFTAITTHPSFDQSVSGIQEFTASGAYDGSFTGTVTNTVDSLGVSNQEIVVDGTGAGLTNGSIFDTTDYGHGFENIYTDILGASGGAGTVTDTLVTPFGDVNLPVFFDATSAVPLGDFAVPGSAAADLASILDPANFSGLLTDLGSLFDAGSFLAF